MFYVLNTNADGLQEDQSKKLPTCWSLHWLAPVAHSSGTNIIWPSPSMNSRQLIPDVHKLPTISRPNNKRFHFVFLQIAVDVTLTEPTMVTLLINLDGRDVWVQITCWSRKTLRNGMWPNKQNRATTLYSMIAGNLHDGLNILLRRILLWVISL